MQFKNRVYIIRSRTGISSAVCLAWNCALWNGRLSWNDVMESHGVAPYTGHFSHVRNPHYMQICIFSSFLKFTYVYLHLCPIIYLYTLTIIAYQTDTCGTYVNYNHCNYSLITSYLAISPTPVSIIYYYMRYVAISRRSIISDLFWV